MYTTHDNMKDIYQIRFTSGTEADNVCELLKELLDAKRTCSHIIFCTRPPIKKPIDEHVTS